MQDKASATEMSPRELKDRLDAGQKIAVLDVREPHELAICSLNNTFHIPMGMLPLRLAELDSYKDYDIVVYCRSGKRSQRAAQFLRENGFTRVANLRGGILAWADEVDPSLPRY
ncbi:MAG TPA: rhodanese-like domain-containing protein [Candidatus Obscuribacterales bacterium]